MNAGLLNTDMLRVIGWTMIHSAWQFLALYAALRGLLFVINKSNSNLRYLMAISVMAGAVIISALTFHYEYKQYFGNSINSFNNQISSIKSVPVQQTQAYKITGNLNAVTKHTFLYYLDIVSPYLTFGWIAGMLFYTLKIISGNIYLYRLRNLRSAFYPGVNEKLLQLIDKMQLNKLIKLTITNSVTQPFTFGNLKPIILLPCSYVANVPMDQLEMILSHELAHIKRYDYLVNMVQTMLEAIFFFNPFFKYLSNTVRNEREYCCDDMASKYCGNEKTMAIALANLKILNNYNQLSLSAAATKNIFYARIHRLIEPGRQSGVTVKTFLLSLIVLLLAAVSITKLVNKRQQNKLSAAIIKTNRQPPANKSITAPVANYSDTSNKETAKIAVMLHFPPPVVPDIAKPVAAADTDTTHRQKPIPEKNLSTVNINGQNPAVRTIVYKTDTVEYRVSEYMAGKLAENAPLDLLIVQMEGFKIDAAGKIFHQGQQISRISIDGNVLAGLKLPVNIPISMVKKVQVCDSGDPVSKTLNFELKKQ